VGANDLAPQCGAPYVALITCLVSANQYVCSTVDQDNPQSSPQASPDVCGAEQGDYIGCLLANGADAGQGDPTSICQPYCTEQQAFQNGVHSGDAGTDAGATLDAGTDASG
jgi:hypothetical protein